MKNLEVWFVTGAQLLYGGDASSMSQCNFWGFKY